MNFSQALYCLLWAVKDIGLAMFMFAYKIVLTVIQNSFSVVICL